MKKDSMDFKPYYCEKCKKLVNIKYGSGRFCSRQCANSRVQTDARNKKRSLTLINNKDKKHFSGPNKKIREKYYTQPKICPICNKIISFEYKNHKTCSKECTKILQGMNALIQVKKKKKYRGWYKNIYCDSQWELAYVIYCLDHNINIERNYKGFEYKYKNKTHMFYPDFIVNGDLVEIKAVFNEKTIIKLEAIKDRLTVIDGKQIKFYFDYIKNKYNILKDRIYELYEK